MDITWWQAILLGLAQGLTEFIPVSSSAHLNLLHWLFGQERELPFDVTLHIGTLAALVFYFRRDWVELIRNPEQRKLRNLVILACIPGGVAGLRLRDLEDKPPLSEPWCNATMLIFGAMLLLGADRLGRKTRPLEEVNLKDSLVIGCSQALALVPGMSRSGTTIAAGLLMRLTREGAARFSFLLSLPITSAAVAFELYGVFKKGEFAALGAPPWVVALGILASAVSGFWAIDFLLNYLKRHDVTIFVVWRIIVALIVFALLYLFPGLVGRPG